MSAAVTIVVVPRERFSRSLATVDQVYAVTTPPFELVVVDAGSPRGVRRGLEERARSHGFRVVRESRYLAPNQARNIGLRHVHTPYVAFLDNDAWVTPHWLERLVQRAEADAAWLVAPLYLIGPPERQAVHMASGDVTITERDGRRRFHVEHFHTGRHLPEVRSEIPGGPCRLIEFHCLLARTDLFTHLPLDEGLMGALEEFDLCLDVHALGGTISLEPASIVSYIKPPPVAWQDIPYFVLRWSDEWFEASLARFCAKWNLDPDDPGFASSRNFGRHERRMLFAGLRRAYHRLPGGDGLKQRLLLPLEEALRRSAVRWMRAAR